MKKLIIFCIVILLSSIFLFIGCKKKEYAHDNVFDLLNPSYTGGPDPIIDPNIGSVSFNSSSYSGTNTIAIISLKDKDIKTTTVNVQITSGADSTGITLTLNGADGNYSGNLTINTDSSIENSKIKVTNEDTITVTYSDAYPAGVRTDSAIWALTSEELIIFDGDTLNSSLGVTLDIWHGSAGGQGAGRSEVTDMGSYMKYEAGPLHGTWAFVAIAVTAGSVDLSAYNKIAYELSSTNTLGNTVVDVGVKDSNDGAGTEDKEDITGINATWQWYTNNLSDFSTLQKNIIILPIEYVFGSANGTIYFRGVKYIKY
ncbi:MAG: hypothetical protein KKH98_15640 [Spirochaetes bacterium]|nr:hypothetical protein [Spirochaetota bacterium]